MTMSPLTPAQLRVAADAYETKAERMIDQGREDEATRCLEIAISLRQQANQQEVTSP